ncbi:MAG: MFS transporter [Burkholderiales bacterium]|nr:MFS transporter [Burkholderiales bacterium]
MALYLSVLLTLFNQISLKGSRMLVALYAIDLGATPFSIGILVSTYAFFPLLLAVYAGRVSDRIGVRLPMIAGSIGTAIGLLLPVSLPTMATLYVSAALIGTSNLFFHVSAHNLIGAIGEPSERTKNFTTLSLGAALAGLFGPLLVGFMIDHAGYSPAYVCLAALGAVPGLVLLCYARFIPARVNSTQEKQTGSMNELLGNASLRGTFIASGLVITGIELFNFYVPIYGRSVGLSASVIGVILGTQAAAAFAVRLWMPRFSKRFGENRVLSASLVMAGVTYLLFPIFEHPAILAVIAFGLGLSLGCGQPLSIVLTYNHSPPRRAGEALGMRLTVNKFTQLAVPIIFGSLGSGFGVYPVFWATASLLLAGGYLSAEKKR